MDLATAIRAVFATLRRRPSDLLPLYLLTMAIPAITRVITFVGIALVWAYLALTGRLDRFVGALDEHDLSPPDPEADPDAFVEWIESLLPIVEIVLTPTSVTILLVAIGVTIVLAIGLAAVAEAAQLAGCFARLRRARGLPAGIRGARSYWRGFLGLYLLEIALWLVVTLVAATVLAVAGIISLALAVLLGVFVVLAWLGAVILIRAVFVFAPVAIVVDEATVFGSLRRSATYIRGDLVGAVGYFALSVGVILGFASFATVIAPLGGGALASIGGAVLLSPALHLLKTALYGDFQDAVSPFGPTDGAVRRQLRAGIDRGLREMAGFVRGHPAIHGVATLSLVIGFLVGWILADPFEAIIDASIRGRLSGIIPPIITLEFFGNNWAVALSTGFSGVALAVPAIVSLLYNGIALGAISRLEIDPEVLLAFVVPHGVFEFPAIIIAGAVGIRLGISTWRTWRTRIDRRTLADELERAFWILIGVGVLLAVASVIEGFFSPFYFRLFL